MGRVVTSFSVEVGSEAHEVLEDLRRKGRNISKVIGELLVHQYQLYDDCDKLAAELSKARHKLAKHLKAKTERNLVLDFHSDRGWVYYDVKDHPRYHKYHPRGEEE